MIRKIQFLILVLIAFSCAPTKITTTNIQDLASFETDGNIYALPKTRVFITATAVHTTFTPGPYVRYAKSQLGIEGAQTSPSTTWEIENIELNRIIEPDPDHFYSIKEEGKHCLFNETLILQEQGYLLFPSDINSFQYYNTPELESVQTIQHTDLSIRPFYAKPKNASKQPGSNTSIPTKQSNLSLKSTQEKANEAATFLFKIRKRRFKLLSGQYEVFPEAYALETSIAELNKLEQEYISLFIGTTSTDTIQRMFSFTPVANEKTQRFIPFKFSEEAGFIASNDAQGTPIIFEITNLETTNHIKSLALPSAVGPHQDIIFYRLSERASLKVLQGTNILLEAELPISQFGPLVPMYIQPKKHSLVKSLNECSVD